MTDSKLTASQLDQLKLNYAEMIVEGMDMDSLITFAVESIEKNLKDWDEDDIKEEVLDYYGDETLEGLDGEFAMTKHDNFMDKLTPTEQDKLYREIVKFEQYEFIDLLTTKYKEPVAYKTKIV